MVSTTNKRILLAVTILFGLAFFFGYNSYKNGGAAKICRRRRLMGKADGTDGTDDFCIDKGDESDVEMTDNTDSGVDMTGGAEEAKEAKREDVCSICLESVSEVEEENATSLMDCDHGENHHKHCIQQWANLKAENGCPLCEAPLTRTVVSWIFMREETNKSYIHYVQEFSDFMEDIISHIQIGFLFTLDAILLTLDAITIPPTPRFRN